MANECRTDDELGIRAMERLLRRAKALDPSRLATYVSNRRQEQNRAFALADLVAVNLYFGMFEEPLARDTSEIEERVYRPTRERLREITRFFADKPVLLSEFGLVTLDRRPKKAHAAMRALWRAEIEAGR